MSQTFRTQLDFNSILKISFTLGFGAGFFYAVIGYIPFFMSGDVLSGLLMFILMPPLSGISTALTMALGVPFYNWYCNRIKGQKMSGKFVEVENKDEI